MLIANARVALSPAISAPRSVEVRGKRMFFHKAASSADAVDLSGYLLLPGLINAHDHLEFNLFPRLGRRTYTNATEWAMDICRPHESPIREHRSLARRDRLVWGGLRNLLSGVTTVAHHNPYDANVFETQFPVRVIRRFGWAHSLTFSPDVAERYRDTPRSQPFIIHAGEGTDDSARSEIGALDRMGILGSRTVIVHGLAFDSPDLAMLKARNSSLIWCPSSNLLTYGRTLRPDRTLRVALGTDSAISSAGDMIDEIRIAHDQCGASVESLYEMVTGKAAEILRLGCGAGALYDGGSADIVAVPDHGQSPAAALLGLAPELVLVRGHIHLISKRLLSRFRRRVAAGFHPIAVEGRGEWLTPFDVTRLLRDARMVLGNEIRLAGKRVSQ